MSPLFASNTHLIFCIRAQLNILNFSLKYTPLLKESIIIYFASCNVCNKNSFLQSRFWFVVAFYLKLISSFMLKNGSVISETCLNIILIIYFPTIISPIGFILCKAESLYFRLMNRKTAPTQQKIVLLWNMERIPNRKVYKIVVTSIHLHSDHDKCLLSNIGLGPIKSLISDFQKTSSIIVLLSDE